MTTVSGFVSHQHTNPMRYSKILIHMSASPPRKQIPKLQKIIKKSPESSTIENAEGDLKVKIAELNIGEADDEEYLDCNGWAKNLGKGGHFGKSPESSPVLVLNSDYTPLSHAPLSLWNWQV